jgi:hypothetical protein
VRPNHDRLLELIREYSTGHAPNGAVGRSQVLLDVGRAAEGLALVAPLLGARDPAAAIQAARCLAAMGHLDAALAALALPGPELEAEVWRAILLVDDDPVACVHAATAVLALEPENVQALWARSNAYVALGQDLAARADLVALAEHQPAAVSTHMTRGRLAESQNKPRDAIAAYEQVLVRVPDHTRALAGLSKAQKQTRPLSSAWVRNLANAAAGDLARHGSTMLDEVTKHRRMWVRSITFAVMMATLFLAQYLLVGARVGVMLVPALLAGFTTSAVMWTATPADVRDRIRRTDQVAGTHRAPDWRRGLVATAFTVAALVVPEHIAKPVPEQTVCVDPSNPNCIHVPSIPPFPTPSSYLPTDIPGIPTPGAPRPLPTTVPTNPFP